MREKLRLGIVGCGHMTQAHARGYEELRDDIVVAAVADTIPERAQAVAAATGAPLAVTNYKEMIDAVDAVLIVLPHDLHYEAGRTFLEAGIHVLMEKPMCNDEAQCIELIRLSERVGKVLMTAYPVRFWPLIIRMKELLDSRAYGDVFQLSVWTEQYTFYEEGHWGRSADRLGGGQFFSHGCHYVDLMLWFLGRPVKGMHMGSNRGTPWMEREGTSNMVMEFENGAMGYHFGTWGARGTRLGYSIHAHCTDGMLEFNLDEQKLFAHTGLDAHRSPGEDPGQRTEVLMSSEDQGKLTQHEIRHFLDCIRAGSKPLTDGPSSLQGLRVIWRMYEAERSNSIADLRGLGLDEDWEVVPLKSIATNAGGNGGAR